MAFSSRLGTGRTRDSGVSMSTIEDLPPSGDEDVDGSKPGETDRPLSRVERSFLHLSIIQTVLAVAGLFTGGVALYAALQQTQSIQTQAEASVWPYAQLLVQSSIGAETPAVSLSIRNSGVGPARFHQTRMSLRGEVITSWPQLLAAVEAPDAPHAFDFLTGRVLKAGEEVTLLSTEDEAAVFGLVDLTETGGVEILICYCSIYGDCWLRDSAQPVSEPQALEACPTYGEEAFRDG